jgi:hypothetical protein
MQSDKYICVRDSVGDKHEVVIVSMADPMNPARRPLAGAPPHTYVPGG